MRIVCVAIILMTFPRCQSRQNIKCKKEFYQCATDCSNICSRAIKKDYEFGKCFSICNKPCREEFCEEVKNNE